MLFKLDNYDDYVKLLLKTIRMGYVEIFEKVIKEERLGKYKLILLEDTFTKERIINGILKTGDEKFSLIVLQGLEIEELPEYSNIVDLLYTSDLRRSGALACQGDNVLINKKSDIYYIFNEKNFEEFWSMEILYQICENDKVLGRIIEELEYIIERKIKRDEMEYILDNSRRYREYIDDEFKIIINDIKTNEESPDSEGDCYGILSQYLGRKPSKWEVKILWESCR